MCTNHLSGEIVTEVFVSLKLQSPRLAEFVFRCWPLNPNGPSHICRKLVKYCGSVFSIPILFPLPVFSCFRFQYFFLFPCILMSRMRMSWLMLATLALLDVDKDGDCLKHKLSVLDDGEGEEVEEHVTDNGRV